MRTLADVLARLGARRAFRRARRSGNRRALARRPEPRRRVVEGDVYERTIDPLELGVPRCDPNELVGGTPAENAAHVSARLRGAENSGARSAILLNAAGAIAAGGHALDLQEGLGFLRARRSNPAPPPSGSRSSSRSRARTVAA